MRTSQLHLQRSAEKEGLRHSCLRQSPPRKTKARNSSKDDPLQGIACDDQLTNTEIANLQRWLQTHHALRGNYPFDEISERKSRRSRYFVSLHLCQICIQNLFPQLFAKKGTVVIYAGQNYAPGEGE